jgi:flagellin
MAMNASRNLTDIYGRLSKSVQRLSSGLRVNSAADDAAGLAIREMMRADIAVIDQGIRNASDAISMIQTAEGAMSVIDEKLTRMKELAEQAATGTYTTAQRLIMNSEYQAMAEEITRIANATDFNGVKLLDGTFNAQHGGLGMKVHFGTGNDADEDYYFIQMGDLRASTATGLRVGGGENYWQTTGLDAADDDEVLAEAGFFGIEYSGDALEDTPTWNMYGFIQVESGDTLQDVVDKINLGRQATGSVNFAALDGTTVAGTSFTLGSYTISYTTAATSSISGATLSVGLATTGTVSASDVATYTAAALNSVGLSSVGVYGAVSGATLNLMAVDGGLGGNEITINVTGTSISSSGDTLEGGTADTGITAEAYEDPNTGEWEIRITGLGSDQARIFTLGASLGASGTVLDGSGTAITSAWATGAVTTTGGTLLSAWASADEVSEWEVAIADWDGQSITTQSGAQLSLAQLDEAINTKDVRRANLGAFANRLENTITNLQIQAENLQAAESRISDADIAEEMTEFTSNNILAQAAVAMLAQANSLPSLALTLLGG